MRHILIICSFLLFISNIAHADIYKYTDENGVTCYTDTTFGKKTERVFKDNSNTSTDRHSTGTGSEKPKSYHRIIHEKASEYNLDPSLIKAVITTESNWNHMAISRKVAMGLMQLMRATTNK